MIREIKFRAKTSKGDWVEGFPRYLLDCSGWIMDVTKHYSGNGIDEPPSDYQESYKIIPETMGQLTGLKDKIGGDIWEGDQLYVCAGYMSHVAFEDGMFVSVYKHPEDPETIPLLDAIGKDTEVIGNIHDTK
ncbi:MAG: hypothetical protein ACI9N9_000086 [Enterobacterales bacterium]|jgi:hypothetical protein